MAAKVATFSSGGEHAHFPAWDWEGGLLVDFRDYDGKPMGVAYLVAKGVPEGLAQLAQDSTTPPGYALVVE